jgi:hypothetical protein
MKLVASFFLIASLLLVGCSTTEKAEYAVGPIKVGNKIDLIDSSIKPICADKGCNSFVLSINNVSEKTIEVNWNKTLFIVGNTTSGGFMFEGIIYKDRNAQKSPDVIFPGGSMTKLILPNNLVSFSSGRYGGWTHEFMPTGDIGVFLTVSVDGRDYSQRMTVNISRQIAQKPAKGPAIVENKDISKK